MLKKSLLSALLTTLCFGSQVGSKVDPSYSDMGLSSGALEECCSESHLFVNTSFLYWKSKIDGLEFAEQGAIAVSTPGPLVYVDLVLKDLNYNWDPGVKVDLGYFLPNRWEVSVDWTYLHSTASNTLQIRDPSMASDFIKPNWYAFLLGAVADSARAQWKLNYNTLDVLVGRNIFLAPCVSFHPYGGLRAAWIYQKYDVNYNAEFFPLAAPPEMRPTAMKTFNRFKGLGVRAGMDMQFYFFKNWSLLAGGSSALVYGKFEVMEDVQGYFTLPNGILTETIRPSLDQFMSLCANFETQLGIGWEHSFADDKYQLAFSFLYNLGYWINQNKLFNNTLTFNPLADPNAGTGAIIFSDIKKEGDLQLMGITLNLMLGF